MNLKIEKTETWTRILASMGESKCPFGCIYCFVESKGYSRLPRIDIPDAREELAKTAKHVDIIQPACDVEPLLVPDAVSVLKRLVEFGKPISFATKAKVTEPMVKALSRIHETLLRSGAILQIAVSISRLDRWQELEPFAPSPTERIKSLKTLYNHGIPTTVAVRPLLPFVPAAEIADIVDLTYRYCYAYLYGRVYVTPALKAYMSKLGMEKEFQLERVTWMPGDPLVEIMRSHHLEQALEQRARIHNLPVFESNVNAVLYLTRK